MTDPARIPEHGRDAAELLADIEARHADDRISTLTTPS